MKLTASKAVLIALAGVAAYLTLRVGAGNVASSLGAALSSAADAINPTSSNNLAYRGSNAIVQSVTNDPYATLGTKIWETFNPGAVAAEKTALGSGTNAWTGNVPITWTAADQEDADLGLAFRNADVNNPYISYQNAFGMRRR